MAQLDNKLFVRCMEIRFMLLASAGQTFWQTQGIAYSLVFENIPQL